MSIKEENAETEQTKQASLRIIIDPETLKHAFKTAPVIFSYRFKSFFKNISFLKQVISTFRL